MRTTLGVGLAIVLLLACGGGEGRDPGDTAPSVTTLSPATSSDTSDGSSSTTGAPGGDTTSDPADTGSTGPVDPDTGPASTGPDDTTGGGGTPACPEPGAPQDCSPGSGSGRADTCFDLPPCFLNLVKSSVTGVIDEHPEWFDQSSGQPFVLEVESYMDAVVQRVNEAGECAIRDPNAGDEIAVKHDNDFAESFDILTAEGVARYGDGIYTAKCIPAWF
jgi:hypothetical protein